MTSCHSVITFILFTLSKLFPLRLNVRLINATFDCAVIDLQKQADMVHASLADIRVVIYPAESPAKAAARFELIYTAASKLIRTFAP